MIIVRDKHGTTISLFLGNSGDNFEPFVTFSLIHANRRVHPSMVPFVETLMEGFWIWLCSEAKDRTKFTASIESEKNISEETCYR